MTVKLLGLGLARCCNKPTIKITLSLDSVDIVDSGHSPRDHFTLATPGTYTLLLLT